MLRFRLLVLAALVGAACLLAPPGARADFAIKVSTNGGTTFTTVADNGAQDQNPAAGAITFSFEGLIVTASAFGTTGQPQTSFDLQVNSAAVKTAQNLVVEASMTGLQTEPPPQTLQYTFTGSVLGASSVTTHTFETVVSQNNTLFSTSSALADTGALTVTNTSPKSGMITFSGSVPYSITTIIKLKTGKPTKPGGSIGFNNDSNNQINAVPAPAGLVLGLAALPLLGLGAWLRRRRLALA